MIRFSSALDLTALASEIATLPKTVDGTGALMAFPPSGGLPDLPAINKAVAEIAGCRQLTPLHVMANVLPAGCVVGFHRDWLKPSPLQGPQPRLERWHLVITTNDSCWWQDEVNGEIQMECGYWYGPLPYWKLHNVSNLGASDRLHLVVDLDCPVPLGDYA